MLEKICPSTTYRYLIENLPAQKNEDYVICFRASIAFYFKNSIFPLACEKASDNDVNVLDQLYDHFRTNNREQIAENILPSIMYQRLFDELVGIYNSSITAHYLSWKITVLIFMNVVTFEIPQTSAMECVLPLDNVMRAKFNAKSNTINHTNVSVASESFENIEMHNFGLMEQTTPNIELLVITNIDTKIHDFSMIKITTPLLAPIVSGRDSNDG